MAECCRDQTLEWLSLSLLAGCLGIRVAFISRISNAAVLRESGQTHLGRQLVKQQLLLYGKVARSPNADPPRMLTFLPGTLLPVTGHYVRRIGRPRNEWAAMLYKEICKMGTGLRHSIYIELEWRRAVYDYCMST